MIAEKKILKDFVDAMYDKLKKLIQHEFFAESVLITIFCIISFAIAFIILPEENIIKRLSTGFLIWASLNLLIVVFNLSKNV